jgi:hypothetical protein
LTRVTADDDPVTNDTGIYRSGLGGNLVPTLLGAVIGLLRGAPSMI